MKRANAVLFSLLMIVSSLAGCLGGEEVDTSEYEDQIAELEEMLEMQNQTIAQREATIDGLEDGLSDATQMIQDHAEGITILEAYRDSLLVQLEKSNNTSAELITQLEIANTSIALMQSQIMSLESDALEHQSLIELWEIRAFYNDYSHANFREANLTAANFRDANLSYADLGFSNLSDSDFAFSDLNNAVLEYANLESSSLFGANLSNANLNSAVLNDAGLRYTYFYHATMNNANLIDADMTGASLQNANLTDTDLTYADFGHANLTGADLTGAVFGNVYWYNTICPDGTNSDDNGNTCENNL